MTRRSPSTALPIATSSGRCCPATPVPSSRPAKCPLSRRAKSAAWRSSSRTMLGAIAATKGQLHQRQVRQRRNRRGQAGARSRTLRGNKAARGSRRVQDPHAGGEIANTGPYMHDGSLKTLDEVVEQLQQGGVDKNGKLPAWCAPGRSRPEPQGAGEEGPRRVPQGVERRGLAAHQTARRASAVIVTSGGSLGLRS